MDRHFSMLLRNGVVQENLSVESNGSGRGILLKLPGEELALLNENLVKARYISKDFFFPLDSILKNTGQKACNRL